MKRIAMNFIALICILATIFSILPLSISAHNSAMRVRFNGVFLHVTDNDQPPITVDNHVLIPLRAVMGLMGIPIEWDAQTQTATLIRTHIPRAHNVYIQIGNFDIHINESYTSFPVPPRIVNNRTMVTICTVAYLLAANVNWDSHNSILEIRTINERVLTQTHMPMCRDNWPVNSSNWPEHLPRHMPGSIILHPERLFSSLIDVSSPMQFRAVFYNISAEFMDLVPVDELGDWLDGIGETYLDSMMLMRFVQYFNITREEFDRVADELRVVLERMATRGTIDIADEFFELPNADIIFTFDNDIIRYYFRRE